MDGQPREVMLAMTTLVRKPPSRSAWGGFLIEWRKVAFAGVGVILVLPVAFTLLRLGGRFQTLGLLTIVVGALTGLFVSAARPDGQSIPQYLIGLLTGKVGTHDLDGTGERAKVYVGLAPVADFHAGQRVVLVNAAVEVHSSLIDERGALKTEQ